jgi:hypothetical protein
MTWYWWIAVAVGVVVLLAVGVFAMILREYKGLR